jgi:sporadic carbohydrate cluster 2OG-Fe(II) oxygenase
VDIEVSQCIESIQRKGFGKYRIENLTGIIELKEDLARWLATRFSIPSSDFDQILNNIHQLANFKNESEANQLTLDAISYLSNKYEFDKVIFESCQNFFISLFGQDIHSQRANNIVVQHPRSTRNSELHIDAPPSSKFEVVSWLPLVDCFGTKSFYLVPIKRSMQLVKDYKEGRYSDWNEFKGESLKEAELVNVAFGEVLFFSSCQLHGSEMNETSESRWCLNTRFKSLFAPCGTHDPLSYYRVLSIGPLSKIGLAD